MTDINQPLDIIIASKMGQQLFLQRCEELSVTPEAVYKYCGISKRSFDAWINSLDSDDAVGKISQADVIKLFSTVFINVNVTFAVMAKEELTDEQNQIIESLKN